MTGGLSWKRSGKPSRLLFYVVVAVWAPMAFWSWALNAPLHGVWIPVGWGFVSVTVAGLLWVRVVVLRWVRAMRAHRQERSR